MTIKTITFEPSATQTRIYEMLTENTGSHFLDSGMSNGRHWQQNQGHTIHEWMQRPSAILETEYGTYPTLDLFGFLTARLELTERAQEFQQAFDVWINEDSERSPYSCGDIEEWAQQFHDGGDFKEVRIANSYNWDNYLSQTIQYVDFQFLGHAYTVLQVHGGADVRGGYTRPQVFETQSLYWSYDMQNAEINCTNEDCDFTLSISGCVDILGAHGSTVMTSSEFHELKACPECGSELDASAPEPGAY